MPLPLSGVAVRWMSWPSRSTPRVSGLPAERSMMSVIEFGPVNGLPSIETMVSPAFSPASGGRRRAVPVQCSSDGDRVVVRRLPEAEDEDQRQDEGDEEVHGRAGRGHDDPLMERLLAVGPGLVLLGHLLVEVKPVMRT